MDDVLGVHVLQGLDHLLEDMQILLPHHRAAFSRLFSYTHTRSEQKVGQHSL